MPQNPGNPSPQSLLQSSVIESQAVHVGQLKGVIDQFATRVRELETAIETLTQAAKEQASEDQACDGADTEEVNEA